MPNQTGVKLCMVSSKLLDVLHSINKENFLLPLIDMKRLRGKTLSLLWQDVAKRTITTWRCKFDSLNMKQMRDFLRELLSQLTQDANQALEDQREILVTEVTSEVRRRDDQVHYLRRELSLHALHSADVTQQQSQKYAGLHQHMTGSLQETLSYREMFEESRAARSAAGPANWSTSPKRDAELLREVRRQNSD